MSPAIGQLDDGTSPVGLDETVIARVAVYLQNAREALQNVIGILPAAPRCIGEGHAWRGGTAPGAIIPGKRPEVAGFSFACVWIKNRGAGLVCYPAGDCAAICREGMNSLVDRFRSAIRAVNTGFSS